MGLHLLISGEVQGVGYRDWLRDTALRAGLLGWVRNRRDGRVEAVLIGASQPVEDVAESCWRGPGAAKVREVERADWRGDVPQHFSVIATT